MSQGGGHDLAEMHPWWAAWSKRSGQAWPLDTEGPYRGDRVKIGLGRWLMVGAEETRAEDQAGSPPGRGWRKRRGRQSGTGQGVAGPCLEGEWKKCDAVTGQGLVGGWRTLFPNPWV